MASSSFASVPPCKYDVDPSEVRTRSDSFAVKHGSKYNDDVDEVTHEVQRWRIDLTLKGCDILNRVESGSIKWILRQISLLCKPLLSSSRDVGGINAHLQQGKSPLWMSINDIQFVGIWGMEGVGKTIILVSLQILKSAKILCTPCRESWLVW